MHIKKLFEEKEVVYSFEIFPPKPTSPIDIVYKTLEDLKSLKPDYISITFGAGGSTAGNRTCELSSLVKNKYKIEPLSHLTCINSSKFTIDETLKELKTKGIENILALRGDIPDSREALGYFNKAYELIEYIKSADNFGIAAVCYPEGHTESKNLEQDIEVMKIKADAGADYFISQLFFDNKYFYKMLEKMYKMNIKLPVEAGIMPVTNAKQIEKIVSLCGASIPEELKNIINKYVYDKISLMDAGILYAQEQIKDLLQNKVRGIHLYTMNNAYVATNITKNILPLIKTINNN